MRRWGFVIAALLLWLGAPSAARAQGSRKDDIVLNRFGQPVAGATVTVCTSGATGTPCSPLASIFSDIALTQPLANPLTSDGQGNYHFYAAPGRYMVQISGAGATTTTIPDVLLAADPTSPSFQNLNVTQNISALNLTLSGNLTVSGALSSPSALGAPQTGSSSPVQIGPNWYSGTASGKVTSPTVAPVLQQQSTGGSISAGTYYCVVAYTNRNGATTSSPQASIVVASGTTNLVWALPGDNNWVTGAYAMATYCGTASGGPYYQVTPYSRSYTIGNCTGVSNLATCDTGTTRHGLVDLDAITVAGNNVLVNGAQVIASVSEPASGNSTLTFSYSGANFGPTGGGTISYYTGVPNETNTCWMINVSGDGCTFAAIPGSGIQPPSANTAVIDPLQVAVNQTRTSSGSSITTGQGSVQLTAASYSLTTPLIVPYTRIYGPARDYTEQGGDVYPVIKDNGWVNSPHLGVVMMMGPYLTLKNMTIQAVGSGATAPAPFFAGYGTGSQNGLETEGVFFYQSNNSATSPCIRYDDVILAFDWRFKNDNTICGLNSNAMIYGSRSPVASFVWDGGRINAAASTSKGPAVKTRGGAMNKALGTNFGGLIPNTDFQFKGNMAIESSYGVFLDVVGGTLEFQDNPCVPCDIRTSTTIPELIAYGMDYWSNGGSGEFGIIVGPTATIGGSSFANATIRFTGPVAAGAVTSFGQISGSTATGSSVWLDANNIAVPVRIYGSAYFPTSDSCDIGGTVLGNAPKIINFPPVSSNLPLPSCFSSGDFYANGYQTQNVIPGGVKYQAIGQNAKRYLLWSQGGGSTLTHWSGDPGTAANLDMTWDPHHFTWFQNDGATNLFEINAAGNVNQINLCNPGSPANNKINLGCALVDSTGATVKGALTGTTGSIGGSALTAGQCTSGTVSITGAATSMAASVSPSSDPGAGFMWEGWVSSSGTVTVRLCAVAAGTPTAVTYNVRVLQ